MRHDPIPGAVALVALLAAGVTALRAQEWTYGLGVAEVSWNQPGIVGSCNGTRQSSRTVSVFAGRGLVSGLSLVATARIHYSPRSLGASCNELPQPTGAGTYVFETGQNPLAQTFAATDLRLQYQPDLGTFAPLVAAGGGSLFWNAAPTPYWLVAGGLGVRTHATRVSLIAEYQRYGLQLDQTQATYNVDPTAGYPVLVAETDLGPKRSWKAARLLALRVDFAVRTPR